MKCCVVDGVKGTPLAGARIAAFSDEPTVGTTRVGGLCALGIGQPPDTIVVSHAGFVCTTFRFTKNWIVYDNGEEPAPLVLPLLPCGSYRGRVVEAVTFEPIADAHIAFMIPRGPPVAQAVTDEQGCFALVPESYEVSVTKGKAPEEAWRRSCLELSIDAPGYQHCPLSPPFQVVSPLRIETGGQRVLIVLSPDISFEAGIVDPGGNPVSGAFVLWANQEIKRLGQHTHVGQKVFADDQGRFRWNGTRATRRTLFIADHPEFGPGWTLVDWPAEKTNDPPVIRLRRKGRLRGLVLDEDGTGVPRAHVSLVALDVPPYWHYLAGSLLKKLYGTNLLMRTYSGADGTFVLDSIPAGRYRISVDHPELVCPSNNGEAITVGADSYWEARMRRGRTVSGTVLTEEGDPPAKGKLTFSSHREVLIVDSLRKDRYGDRWAPLLVKTVWKEPGVFRVEGLPRVPVRASVIALGYEVSTETVGPKQNEVAIILKRSPPPGERYRLELLVSWEDCFVNARYVASVLYQAGTLAEVEAGKQVISLANGRGVLSGLPAGTFDLFLASVDFEPVFKHNVTVPAESPLYIALRPIRPLRARIRGPSPPGLLEIRLRGEEGYKATASYVDGPHPFLLHGIRPGTYRVEAKGAEGRLFSCPFPVTFTETEIASIELIPVEEELHAGH